MTRSPRTSFRALGQQTALYSAAALLSRAISFVMLPVYTRYLSASDYGVLSLIDSTIEITAILFTHGMTMGLQRFYFKTDDAHERRRIIVSGLVLEGGLGLAAAALLAAAADPITRLVFAGSATSDMIRIAALSFFLSVLFATPLQLLRIQQRPGLIAAVQLTRLLATLSLNILFIAVLDRGPIGILLSTCLVNGATALVLTTWLLRTQGTQASRSAIHDLRRFGVPFQFAWAGDFVAHSSDKYFLKAIRGDAAVGVYGIGTQFYFLLVQLASVPFRDAWTPIRHQWIRERPASEDPRHAKGFLYLSLLLITGAVGLSLFVRPVIMLMTPPEFHRAADVVPLLLLGAIGHQWSDVVRFGIDISERTSRHNIVVWGTALPVVLAYALLIPPFGIHGAALATALGMMARVLVAREVAWRQYPITYGFGRPVLLLAVAAAVVGTVWMMPASGLLSLLAIGAVGLAVYAGAALLLLPAGDRALLRSALHAPRRAFSLLAEGR